MSVQNNVKQNLTEQEINSALKLVINMSPVGKKISHNESINELKLLIKKGFDINHVYKDQNNWTLLHIATYFKKEEMIEALINLGADPNLLLENDISVLHVAATKNLSQSCQKLLKIGLDVDMITTKGKTALMNSCEAGGVETVKVLIKNAANIELKDNNGYDCFYYADSFAKDNYDSTISAYLSEAIMYQDLPVIKTKASMTSIRKF